MKTTLSVGIAGVSEITSLISQGFECWVKAGEMLVELLNTTPNAYDLLIAADKRLSRQFLGLLEGMGRKTLHPELAYLEGPGPRMARRLPYSVQQQVLNEPVELLVETENGTDVLLVDVREMSLKQAEQVFSDKHQRPLGEQKAWRQAKKEVALPKQEAVTEKPFYRIDKGDIVIMRPCRLKPSQMAMLMAQVTR